jgi:hypothetical protein
VNKDAINHASVLVDRPQLPDGRYLLRGPNGMKPTSLEIGPELSAQICAVCGYGLTPRQIEIAEEIDPTKPHLAIPLVLLAARKKKAN